MKITLFFILTFLSLSKNAVFADDKLIQSTCRKTPYYKVCVSAFKSDPRSASADVYKLGLISVDILAAKSTHALSLINKMLKNPPKDSATRKALMDCRQNYKDGVLMGDVPQAKAAISSGNYKFAVDSMNDAASEASSCEQGFSKSPLSDINNYVHDFSMVALSIVHIINGY